MRRKVYGGIAVLAAILICAAAVIHLVRAQAFMTQVGAMAERFAAETLGTDVRIGSVEIHSLHEFRVSDITIYDKQAEAVLRADEARVTLRLFSLLSSPLQSVDEVRLMGTRVHVIRRDDGTWNYSDLISDHTQQSDFAGRIQFADAVVTVSDTARSFDVTGVTGTADVEQGDVSFALSGQLYDVLLHVRGALIGETQSAHVTMDDAALTPLLELLPADTIPADVSIQTLYVKHAEAQFARVDGALTADGRVDGLRGTGSAYGMETELKSAALTFSEQELFLAATLAAGGETARVDGTVRLDMETPALNLTVRAADFAVDRVLHASPYVGQVTADVHVTGTPAAPLMAGHVQAAAGSAYGIPFQEASAEVSFDGSVITVDQLQAQAFGGTVSGAGTFDTRDYAYAGHLVTDGVQLRRLRAEADLPLPDGAEGIVHADLGITGRGEERDTLAVYGSATVTDGVYRRLPIERASASFMLQGEDLTLDFLSANLPNDTDLGVEGRITGGHALDLRFYGGHADLSLLNRLDPRLSFAGVADFGGEVHGDISDPHVEMKVSARNGHLMYQPFDSLLFRAEGSLSGIGIYDFSMEKNGREVWLVNGSVGFTGERRVHVQIDTMGARMEDVAALVAPNEPITGNIDNIITFTGTLDNPHAVGYVHFYRGSYNGVLLSGMDGDYFLDNGIIRLQVFHIYSPMVDMVLNGTISAQGVFDLDTEVRDLDMKRFEHKLPYEVEGHGTFLGKITGTSSHPMFNGQLQADRIVMNGTELREVRSYVRYENGIVEMDRTGFRQGTDGVVSASLRYDMETQALSGAMDMEKLDVPALLALVNQKEDRIEGRITSHATLGGTRENPAGTLTGTIIEGKVAGYEVTDVALDVALSAHVLTIRHLMGRQEGGSFSASGTIDFNGAIHVDAEAKDIALGIFTGLAGVDEPVMGAASMTAQVRGSAGRPEADLKLTVRSGGMRGASFDEMVGEARLTGSVIDLKYLTVNKMVGGQTYAVSARGRIPMRGLRAGRDEMLDVYDQIDLTVSLDHADLSLLPIFSPYIEWALGPTEGNLKISGTLAAPRINGSLQLTGGALKLKPIETPITDMQMQIDALGDAIIVRSCAGKMGAGGYLLTGRMGLDGVQPTGYDFTLVMNELGIKCSFFDGSINGSLQLTEGVYWGEKLPKISGTVDLETALVSVPTIPDTEDELPHIILDIGLTVGRHVHFYSPSLYDIHPSGGIHFGGTTRHPKTTGQIGVRRGDTVSYLRTVFKIREGTATFNQMESFLPEINFYADTRLTNTRVYLYAQGPLDHMDFRLGSSPEMSEEEIIRMLTLRSSYRAGEGGVNTADLLSIGLQMSVLSEVEDTVKNLLHLDVLRLSYGSGTLFTSKEEAAARKNDDEYNVEFGKYINDRVLLRYVQGLGSASDKRRYGIQYDFSDRFGISYDREGKNHIFGVEARIRF